MNKTRTILIVDDDIDDRELIRGAFIAGKINAEYIFLGSGDALLAYLSSNIEHDYPSLIMLDLNMPGRDGRDVLMELKGNFRHRAIPVIVLTTSSSEEDKGLTYGSGANCFITKPNSFDKLVEITNAISRLWLVEQ